MVRVCSVVLAYNCHSIGDIYVTPPTIAASECYDVREISMTPRMQAYCKTLNVTLPFISRISQAKLNRKIKGGEYQLQAKIRRNYDSISNCMVLIRQNKGAKIILHAKSPTFRAAKLKGFTVYNIQTITTLHYSKVDQTMQHTHTPSHTLQPVCTQRKMSKWLKVFKYTFNIRDSKLRNATHPQIHSRKHVHCVQKKVSLRKILQYHG